MKKSVFIGLLCIVVLAAAATAGLVSVDLPGVDRAPAAKEAASAQANVDQGKFYLVQHNILGARDQFKLAVQADPANQEANLLYGVTRVFAVAEDGQALNTSGLDSVKEIFELAGFVFSQLNIYGSTYTAPEEFDPGTPRTGALLDFLKAKLLPEIDGAIANLNIVSNPSFTTVIDPSSINKGPGATLTVDYADALVIKALLQAMKCNLELLMVYGLDVSVPSIQAAPHELMTYKQLFSDSTFLTAKEPARLATAKTALISFIDTYNAAAPFLINRSGSGHHLFVIDVPISDEAATMTALNLDKIRKDLAALKTSLNGGTYLLPNEKMKDQDRIIDLSKFFNSTTPINFRSQVANCTSGIVLPDPTLGGLFPLGLSAAASSEKPAHTADILGVACTGRETPLISINPASIYVADDSPYFVTGPQTLTIKNHGTANLSVTSVNLVGLNSSEFTLTPGTCGTLSPTLTPGGSCTEIVSLKSPYQYYNLRADIQLTSNDVSLPRSFVELWGSTTATDPSPAPTGTFVLTYAPAGTGSGSIEFSVNSYSYWFSETCQGACSGPIETGGDIQIHPIASPGSIFSGWSGCDSVDGDTCSVRMYSAKSVTATFTHDPRTLSVMANPPGGSYTGPLTITLAASKEAAIYYTLNGSPPTAASTPYTGQISLNAPTTTLRFVAIDPYGATSAKTESYTWLSDPILTVSADGNGGGAINSIFPYSGIITCSKPAQGGDTCSTTLPGGTIVTLIASPDSSSLFSGWSSGSCPGTGNCSITLNASTNLAGTFVTMPPVKLMSDTFSEYYTQLQEAYDSAPANSVILLKTSPTFGGLLTDNPISVTIRGGFDAGFNSQTGYSVLQGLLTIGSGNATIDRLIVQ
jgi:hypothetical protein